jgi:hypothetical protein
MRSLCGERSRTFICLVVNVSDCRQVGASDAR